MRAAFKLMAVERLRELRRVEEQFKRMNEDFQLFDVSLVAWNAEAPTEEQLAARPAMDVFSAIQAATDLIYRATHPPQR